MLKTRSQQLIAANRLNRARSLHYYLVNKALMSPSSAPWQAINVMADWLQREYRMGREAQRRIQKDGR